jgi:CTP synthase (UTP-ammonia lyase)
MLRSLMHPLVKIALVGDYNPTVTAHIAIPKALGLTSQFLNVDLEYHWLGTETITDEKMLESFHAIWCVPASPYKNTNGALKATQFARENAIPFLGTCGGYQHALLEFAHNVLNYKEADHAETNPNATMPLVAPLSCALVETADSVTLKAGSRLAEIYGENKVTEMYRCHYGLNPEYVSLFENSGLVISAVDTKNEPRAMELTNHPFFIGVGFQPERSSLSNQVHPLITAFVASALPQT